MNLQDKIKEFEDKAAAIYQDTLKKGEELGVSSEELYYAMNFHLAHIVWEDENYMHNHIDYCLRDCSNPEKTDKIDPKIVELVIESLNKLKELEEFTEEMFDAYF